MWFINYTVITRIDRGSLKKRALPTISELFNPK